MPIIFSEKETELFARRDLLHFTHLPAYARFLLENRLLAFTEALIATSREIKVPLLKYFESMPEAQFKALSLQGADELLTSFAENKAQEFIDKSLRNWLENQVPLIQQDDVVIEDISKVGFARRKAMRDLLPDYTSDIKLYVRVMEEMDRFTVALEEDCYKVLFQIKQEKINENHHFLDKINNASPGIIYVFDLLEQKEVYSNHKREELLGYTEEDVAAMGSSLMNRILHAEDLPVVQENMKKMALANDGEVFTHEYRVQNKQGEFRWHRTYETVFKRTLTGDTSQIIGISIDVTEEKAAAIQLENTEHNLREAQEIAGLASFEWDMVGANSVFSPQLAKIFNLEKKTNLGAFIDHVHPSDRKKVRDALDKALQTDGIYECEYRYGTGQQEKVIWSRGLVRFKEGVPQKMNGTIMDVTQRYYTLKRLERSEELHKQAQALTHIGNWSWLIGENIVSWSDELYRIYGLEPQSEVINFERFMSLVHPDDRGKRQQEIQQALQTLHADDYTMRIRLDDGQIKILQGKGEVLVDEDNQPYKLVGTCQDITEQALLHEQLRQNEETFRQLITNAPDAVIVIDENSNILLWNPKAENIFGWTETEIIGKNLSETIMPPRHKDQHLEGIKRLQKTGQSRVLNRTIEITAIKKDGEEFYIALSIARSFRAGVPVFISFIRDISKEKNAEFEMEEQRILLAQKNVELERTNQELMAFNYIASHDLKEPVRKIKIFSDLITSNSSEELPADAKNYVNRISAAASHMQGLIDALYAFSLATSGDNLFVTTDLNNLLEVVKNSLKYALEEQKAIITATILPALSIIPFQFQQLLENLITNAVKYSRPDVRPEIHITADLVAGADFVKEEADVTINYYAISIRDNGIGFDQQYASKIFQLFQRLHGKNEYSGTGIGLAICKKIVRHHHGFITAQGELGRGATFTVYIPA